MLSHYAVVAIVDETRFQAMCNPFKCGWVGALTESESEAELERDNHNKESLNQ